MPSDEHVPLREVALAVSSALVLLIESLSEPPVPYNMYEQCAAAVNREEAFEVCFQLQLVFSVLSDIVRSDNLPAPHAVCESADLAYRIPSLLPIERYKQISGPNWCVCVSYELGPAVRTRPH